MKEPERFATPEFPAHQSYVTDEFPYDCIGKMKGIHNLITIQFALIIR